MTISSIEIQQSITSAEQISRAAAALREEVAKTEITPDRVLTIFESWGGNLATRELDDIPGIVFLRMWLRRGTLEPIILRELGPAGMNGGWSESGRARYKAFPVGVVGHWPAANVEIQPLLSMTCALLGGNASLVRVPRDLGDLTRILMERLVECDGGDVLARRIFMAAFDHNRRDLHEAMARAVDGAMVWGGQESVLQVRSLPFPHWTRIAVFGPRTSIAAIDVGAWSNSDEAPTWCLRIARDVWQFDQQACSSPQVLFLEKDGTRSTAEFLSHLRRAFENENRVHPRQAIAAGLTSAIAQARASWLLNNAAHSAIFPQSPDWTILVGEGFDLPKPVQGKTLAVLEVDDLEDAISRFDGNVQTLGLGVADAHKESKIVEMAGRRGVDRIVKLGRMHVFNSPWDGVDLVRPMMRLVRHVASQD
jgi:hypothetical protein